MPFPFVRVPAHVERELAGMAAASAAADGEFVYAVPSKRQFGEAAFLPAEDVRRVAERLIDRHAASFGFLRQFQVAYLWKAKGGASKGTATLGKCEKASPLVAYFGEHHLIVWLAADHCRELRMTERQVEALVFHELSHASLTEDGDLAIVGHDFEGFASELREYGPWSADLQIMARAVEQLRMNLDGDDEDAEPDGDAAE